ncbi:hypothetical protein [Sphingobacterium sp. UDSM-2020]|nr:hypothetical protein [Sphingobacterium sp. UDSM-2020]QQD15865.1 hypothetical protein JAZ75_10255 [Sphingobacterium sp. UDSM-2020]
MGNRLVLGLYKKLLNRRAKGVCAWDLDHSSQNMDEVTVMTISWFGDN